MSFSTFTWPGRCCGGRKKKLKASVPGTAAEGKKTAEKEMKGDSGMSIGKRGVLLAVRSRLADDVFEIVADNFPIKAFVRPGTGTEK